MYPRSDRPNPNLSPRRVAAWTLGLLAVGIAANVMLHHSAQAAPQVGQAAPAFAVQDSHGKLRKLSDMRGKVVVLEWTNHGCPFVKKHYDSGHMQALQKQAASEDVVWLSVVSSAEGKQGHVSSDEANALTAKRKAQPTAVLLDGKGELGRQYGAQTTPHMFVIDGKGVLRYMGGIDSIPSTKPEDIEKAEPLFENALEAVIEGKDVAKPVTRPYGCSVKYAG